LKSKSEVTEKFIEFKNLAENQTNKRIKMIRSDNGSEYTSKKFSDLCKANGILQQFSNIYTPQQNGTAERFNRTLVEKARCLLFDANLSKHFWAEAINMATYLINKSVINSSGNTADELFFGKKSDLSELKLFGSSVMVHTPKEKRAKWDKKSKKYVFVGYDSQKKGYRCVNKGTGTLIVSRDVKFLDENFSEVPEHDESTYESILPIDESPNRDETVNDLNESSEDDPEPDTTDEVELNDEQPSIITVNDDEDDIEVDTEDDVEDDVEDDDQDDVEVNTEDDTIDDESQDPNYRPTSGPSEQLPSNPAEGTRSKTNRLNLFNFGNFGLLAAEPKCAKEARNDQKWKAAMEEEINSHEHNGTWELTTLPPGRKAVKSKWVFKTKRNETGEVTRYKARLVAKGFTQEFGVDYHETFSPVVRYTSIRLLIALAVKNGLKIHQMDVVTAYLQSDLAETVFMEQPDGYHDGSKRVCRLKKSIYGLKQAGKNWNAELKLLGLKKSKLDPCVYHKRDENIYMAIYVDDFLIFYKDDKIAGQIPNEGSGSCERMPGLPHRFEGRNSCP
jgi:Reverse transcriptase (RNA-dependent DNA polymerase)